MCLKSRPDWLTRSINLYLLQFCSSSENLSLSLTLSHNQQGLGGCKFGFYVVWFYMMIWMMMMIEMYLLRLNYTITIAHAHLTRVSYISPENRILAHSLARVSLLYRRFEAARLAGVAGGGEIPASRGSLRYTRSIKYCFFSVTLTSAGSTSSAVR